MSMWLITSLFLKLYLYCTLRKLRCTNQYGATLRSSGDQLLLCHRHLVAHSLCKQLGACCHGSLLSQIPVVQVSAVDVCHQVITKEEGEDVVV